MKAEITHYFCDDCEQYIPHCLNHSKELCDYLAKGDWIRPEAARGVSLTKNKKF